MLKTHRLPLMLILGVTLTSRAIPAQSLGTGPAVTAADVRFMQEMITHHRQAIEMTALLARRTRRGDLKSLAERISVSQTDEIAFMRRWLARHAGTTPGVMSAHDSTLAHDLHGMSMMPGMLTAGQLKALRDARGRAFDRLFLQGMIQHHEGALAMVKALTASNGAAQESALNRFVIDVGADQRAEITRMRRLLSRM